MKKIKLILKATLFCLAAVLSMSLAQAATGTTNLLNNYSFELPAIGKITTGYDTVPYWFSSNPTPPAVPNSGIQTGEAPPDGVYDAFTLESDGYHARQTTSHVIQQGECFLCSAWIKNEWVSGTSGYVYTNAYMTMVLYYGGTSNVVVGGTNNASLGTLGTPFFTNTFVILPAPGQHSHTLSTDWTNYFFGVITDAVPALAIGQPLGIDMWQSTTQFNSFATASQCWLDFDDVWLYATNGIAPIPTPVTLSPTNIVFGGDTLTFTENAFGSTTLAYQWRTDGGSGLALTNILPGSAGVTGSDTNIMTVVTSTNAGVYRYAVVISNNYGAITTAVVSYTVRGLIAPIITQDTGTADFGPITNIFAFNGGNVNFYAAFDGVPVVTNQWMFNNGTGYASIAGATNNLRILTNVQAGSVGFYRLGATNAYGSSNSTPAHLTALADPAALLTSGVTNMYSHCVMTNNPWAYWKFEETNDTLTSSMQAYDYSGHNFDATYGSSYYDGGENTNINTQYGPIPGTFFFNGYPGFPANNLCAGLGNTTNNGYLKAPPLNLNANTVTFTMWIYPSDPTPVIAPSAGLLMNRNGNDVAGVGFSGSANANLATTVPLGYTWNSNSSATYGWNSKLYPVAQKWQFVAYVISPQNTTIYLYYITSGTTNLYKAVNFVTNAPEAFNGGTTWIGGDNNDSSRTFNGCIDEVAVFTNAMSESQIQGLFLRSLGLTNGVAPSFTLPPASTQVFTGQSLLIPSLAGGIPNPSYQWQFWTGAAWANAVNSTVSGVFGATNATFGWATYTYPYTLFRCIAYNGFGTNISSSATVTILPVANWNQGLWTVNFAVPSANNSGPNTNYVGRGVLGTGTYWNVLSGGYYANTAPSLRDDGVTPNPVNLGATNSGNGNFYNAGNNVLLDQYMNFSTNGTSMVFTDVPDGRYNLAVYMIDAGPEPSYADRGTTVTVQGVPQSVVNAQDVSFLPDNTVIYTNLLVTNGILAMHLQPNDSPLHTPNTEGDFNGAQLELITAGPALTGITQKGTNFTLSWVGGGLYQATNLTGPWFTNTASSPFTNPATGAVRFFRIYNPNFH